VCVNPVSSRWSKSNMNDVTLALYFSLHSSQTCRIPNQISMILDSYSTSLPNLKPNYPTRRDANGNKSNQSWKGGTNLGNKPNKRKEMKGYRTACWTRQRGINKGLEERVKPWKWWSMFSTVSHCVRKGAAHS